jgi:CDP-diacylglycerol--glycerol-3-phosphate 3-phosphatidyltransferase
METVLRSQWFNWPNRLSLLRIFLVAPFVVLLLNLQNSAWPWSRHAAAVLFIITNLSDGLDGYLARKLHQETPLGRFLDPVADKLLIFFGMILLGVESTSVHGPGALSFQFPDWVVVGAVGKDIFVTIGFALIFVVSGRVYVEPGWSGKSTTVAQMALILVTLMAPDIAATGEFGADFAWHFTRTLWIGVTLLAMITCWDYFRLGMSFVDAAEKPAE